MQLGKSEPKCEISVAKHGFGKGSKECLLNIPEETLPPLDFGIHRIT